MNKTILFIIILIIIGIGAFYGGMKYTESKAGPQNFQNLSAEERQQMLQTMGGSMGSRPMNGRFVGQAGEGFVNGEIIAKDEKSITIKLQDGGSKIIFFSESADITITQSVKGFADDFKQGQQIMVSGEQNSDGSYTAQTIQIRQMPAE